MSELFPASDQRCRSCGAVIVWAKTLAGNRAPFDATPSPVGTHAIVDERAVPRSSAEAGAPLHVSHFATCPQAGQWRGR